MLLAYPSNRFLKHDGHRAVAVDWGSSEWASPLRDAAYFLGNGLTVEDRRKWEKDLLKEYLAELNRLSKVKMSWEHAWEEYRLQSIYGLSQQYGLPSTVRIHSDGVLQYPCSRYLARYRTRQDHV